MHDFLKGVIAPFFTPCHPDRRIDFVGAANLVDYLADTGAVRSVFLRSGMGRMFSFTLDETRRFAEATVPRAKARGMGALLGCAGEWLERDKGEKPDPGRYLEQSIELARFAAEVGADAVVLVLPAALHRPEIPGHETVWNYVRAVHDVSTLPIVLYQAPGLPVEIRLTPESLKRLRGLKRVAGAKVSSGEEAVMGPLARVVRRTNFALICGNENYYLKGLAQGAVGTIGEGCCGYPEILAAVETFWRAGRKAEAEKAQQAVGAALAAKGDLDGAQAWLQLMIRRGARCQPYVRGAVEPYPDEKIAALDRAVAALYQPLKEALA